MKMTIELKNLKHARNMSEETNAFTADVYVNGIKCGYAKNQGHGGNTHYEAIEPYEKNRELIKQAEAFCKALPPVKSEYFPKGLAMDLELFIDELVEADLDKGEQKRIDATIKRACLKYIVWGIPGELQYRTTGWKGRTLAQVLALPQGPASMKAAIASVKAKLLPGETIWNTNLQGYL